MIPFWSASRARLGGLRIRGVSDGESMGISGLEWAILVAFVASLALDSNCDHVKYELNHL